MEITAYVFCLELGELIMGTWQVYGPKSDTRLSLQTGYNLRELVNFLASPLVTDNHKLKVQLRLAYVWGEDAERVGLSWHSDLVDSVMLLKGRGVCITVHVRTHPRWLDPWVDMLVSRPFFVAGFRHKGRIAAVCSLCVLWP